MREYKCSFAHADTYGHECGKPAVLAAPQPCDFAEGGIFWARRCKRCSEIPGGENHGLGEFVPFNPAAHVNHFRW